MKIIKITFTSGDSITTRINGTESAIREYYKIGNKFNLGIVDDKFDFVKEIEFIS